MATGASWTLSFDMFITAQGSNSGRDCYAIVYGLLSSDSYVPMPPLVSGVTQKKSYSASGVQSSGQSPFQIGAYCGGGSTPVTIAFDNIKLSLITPEAGADPTVLLPIQVLKNGDFSGPTLSPWTTQVSNTSSTITLVDGAALGISAPLTARQTSQSLILRQDGLTREWSERACNGECCHLLPRRSRCALHCRYLRWEYQDLVLTAVKCVRDICG